MLWKPNLWNLLPSSKHSAIEQVAIASDDEGEEGKRTGREWTKGVLYCVWFVSGVLVANIILTIIGVVLAYSKYGSGEFGYAPVYQGKCSVAKNSATGIHLVINILSTIMLGASNYCMQCLAAPSRSEVDEAHRKRTWLAIGIPDIAHLVLRAPARRRWLGIVLLVTSFPIHLIYNSAAYYSMQPQEYGVSVFHDIRALENLESTHLKLGYGACFDKYTGMNASELQQVIRDERYERLNKKDCIDRFAQDYLLRTEGSSCDDQYIAAQRRAAGVRGKRQSRFGFYHLWMCSTLSSCDASTLRDNMDDWVVEAYRWFPVQLLYDLDGFHPRKRADTESESNFECTESGATMEMQLPTFTVDHCLSIPAEESCQLVFLPPVCLAVIFCNAIKLVCMVLAARDDREEVFLNIGDAVASFLTCPDPATESAGLLSKDTVKKGTQGWHKTSLIYSRIPPTEIPPITPQHLPPRKRWAQAVSKARWLGTVIIFVLILIPVSYLLSLGIENVTTKYTSSIWAQGLGQPRSGTIITGIQSSRTFPRVLALILLCNTPQLLLSCAYFTYNACLTCMFAAVEYDSYSMNRKYLRVSWPRGRQRSTYYLTLPYRYSLPILVASATLHWLVSQSFFYVEIIGVSMDGWRYELVTCGFSPVAIIFAIILGVGLLFVAAMLGARRFSSHMPIIGYCSAAISAACHPGTEGNHAMKPIQWGEVSSESGTSGSAAGDDDDYGIADHASRGDRNWNPRDYLLEEIELNSLERKVYHCSFTSGEVVEPSPARLYI
ncbi:hypothetical protein N7519_003580 [Penicillium mononematosum]|uniref:uncharacterized protein n=1 Tax=Penicillium mononematosum TaxID=268346 RepID=UPI002547F184|nr:uncharacterized protein N7519_003580 [Penicillium mononematosum]KAJ6188672.1 hypothetical protein N7519_003580 [Penicillium mononematosum]